MPERIREAFAQIEGRAAPFYGVTAAFATASPLVVGAVAGHTRAAATLSLGAYLVALRAPEGPYGRRARNLLGATLVVAFGATVGGLLAGQTWLAVLVVPPIVALGITYRWIGPTAAMAVVLTAVRPGGEDVLLNGTLELLGGLYASALLLAPWPARRLRPLRTALADAADAVATALDAVAQDIGHPDARPLDAVDVDPPRLAHVAHRPDWDDSRRAAREAVTAARTTLASYGLAHDGSTRPERLLDALGRVNHEIVALRSLIEAADRHPPEREWELEARVAVLALAARLRLIAGAVASAGTFPLGAEESGAVRRLVRRTEVIRRASLAGDEDLVAAALVAQVRRSLDRITNNVAIARDVTSSGVRVGVAAPQLSAPSGDLFRRFAKAVRTRSPGFRQSTRVGLAVAVAMALTAALKLAHGHWMTITVMQGTRHTYGETVTGLMQRVGGTVAGSAVAAVLLALVPGKLAASLVLFVFATLAFTLKPVNFTFWALFGTPLAMMLLDFSTPSTWTAAAERIALTLAGAALVFLAVRVLWPPGFTERIPHQLGRVLRTQAALVREAAGVVQHGHERIDRDVLNAAEEAVEDLADTRRRLAEDRVPDEATIARLRDVVRVGHRIRDHLIAVGRMSREESVDAGPVPDILDLLADQLDEAAAVLGDAEAGHEGGPPGERLDDEFSALDDHLSGLARRRRAEVEGGVAPDAFTPLRHALLQVSGTRYALRSLRQDTDELIAAALKR
ncbi:FUSC family protein [Actinomadura flavalba]|uniref:FUSC family protein n=1 Tax=Actinomadura flavalba TaxID=1120938 RepID=UPI0003A3744F|nr:FUSC family protein [Actinomadura flavalba]